MSLFANLGTAGLEESIDRVGRYSPLETGVYTGVIKAAYAGQSKGGAHSVSLIITIGDQEYRETSYITNRKGENFYLNKQDSTKKVPLPGFTIIDDICLVTSGKPLCEQNTEEKVIKLYDVEAKKELPKSVPMLTDIIGLQVTLGIVKQLVNKTEKSGDEYVPTAETKEENYIDKVFHTETKMTVAEARSGAENAAFQDAWSKKNTGQTRDKREIKDGVSASSGPPKRPGMPTAPTAGSSAPRKSLFGAK